MRVTKESPHTALCRQIGDLLSIAGCWHQKNLGVLGQRKGLPDFVACVPQRWYVVSGRPFEDASAITPYLAASFVAIEAKTGTGTLRDDQTAEKCRIEAAGGVYLVIRDIAELAEWLSKTLGRELRIT